jgi:hypothetical protein
LSNELALLKQLKVYLTKLNSLRQAMRDGSEMDENIEFLSDLTKWRDKKTANVSLSKERLRQYSSQVPENSGREAPSERFSLK